MRAHVGPSLLALELLLVVLLGNWAIVPSSSSTMARAAASGISDTYPYLVAPTPTAILPAPHKSNAPDSVPPADSADLALQACRLVPSRPACDAAARELADYGIDLDDVTQWTLVGLRHFVEAVEHLADAFGGGGRRAQRIARFTLALQTGPDGVRVRARWDAMAQERDGDPVRGGYAAERLYFNPNTLFLDMDTPDEVLGRDGERFWWIFIHELAHLWDERSAPVAVARHSARMQRWVHQQQAAGGTDEYPSSYAIYGGMLEAFADSVAATITGDSAHRDYYGSPRDHFVRTLLCEAVECLR